ncbi:MAG: hypothetical protein IPP02_16095 [Chitinophagaceae bacterium]|nr:hypothetical protein [Chitinophagaceae bacterium]
MKSSKDFIYQKLLQQAGLTKYPYDEIAMRDMTDSVLDLKPMTEAGKKIVATTPMFKIGESVYDATNGVNYANTLPVKTGWYGCEPTSR